MSANALCRTLAKPPSLTDGSALPGAGDERFTISAEGSAYWVGEAMQKTDYLDRGKIPEELRSAIAMAAANGADLARLLDDRPYPGR
jgi:hypothetical protein